MRSLKQSLSLHRRGAISTRLKIVTLAEVVKRRLLYLDRKHLKKEILKILRKNSQKLIDSTYSPEVREEILRSGITQYHRLVLQDMEGGRSLYRSSEEMKKRRILKSFHSGLGQGEEGPGYPLPWITLQVQGRKNVVDP